MALFCGRCGVDIENMPFHAHTNADVALHPCAPFCPKCGKSLRVGFIPSATCRCSVGNQLEAERLPDPYPFLAARLRGWAQNEEMVDTKYTDHGRDCIAAAKILENIGRDRPTPP